MAFSLKVEDVSHGGQTIADFDTVSEMFNIIEYTLNFEMDFMKIQTLMAGGMLMGDGLTLQIMEF